MCALACSDETTGAECADYRCQSGLGAAIAEAFVAEGASAYLCARAGRDSEATRARLAAMATSRQVVLAEVADVADAAQVDAWVASGLRALSDVHNLVGDITDAVRVFEVIEAAYRLELA